MIAMMLMIIVEILIPPLPLVRLPPIIGFKVAASSSVVVEVVGVVSVDVENVVWIFVSRLVKLDSKVFCRCDVGNVFVGIDNDKNEADVSVSNGVVRVGELGERIGIAET